ncbi:MAG: exodeoxyribonuclease V subunit gamma [Desulfobacula sp.]|nr:exodeoxyribonuclease V subunit gamma [Desulfobacula sp.]MBT3484760.1 exodeoxyribonuclease V subunit gamma [Desulfobacula sp.]MBT3804390.1 exodeoxyribonuclease V subunit gamma [Desulfobacula sp.]MBT4025181.1 exodeoxyribonuclease V subunit gamma [Desulfobacula sp.]MBT4198583.1 exodeoxyribonuclease V subunit gamma [Desulfobacula sp.]
MEALASVLEAVPDNPMMPEWIGIQSRGMKQWITMQTAKKLGVCTNMHFFFPRQMIDQIITSYKPLENQGANFNEDHIFWSVMKLILENGSQKSLSSIENYIKNDETGKKLYQLSMKIAKVFDDYQVYRSQMLIDWQTHSPNEVSKDPAAKWQEVLWRKIVSKDPHNHMAYKTRFFLEKFSSEMVNKDNLPSRISFFGISALPEIFLQVFEKMSQIMDINFFLLAPSNLFFFDIKSPRQLGKMAVKEETGVDPEVLYYEMTNPLLSSLGTSGKLFHSCLESFNYHEPFDYLFQDPVNESGKSNTMLVHIKSDILNLVSRKQGDNDTPVTIAASDTSICIHACHSPMREAQVLKDLLLEEFEKDPELSPHDIIVMMPDIESYAPFIESVFTLETLLPFSISDRRKRSESESLDAFLKILALRNARLEQKQVLDLLLSDSIAKKFNISFDEIHMIEEMVEDAKILWGKDAKHRENLGLQPFEENTWQFGLQRLFMGMAMPENHESLVKGIMPCQPFEGLDLEVLGKFAAFCHTLFSCLEFLDGRKTIKKWCEELKKISALLIDRNFKNGEDLIFLIQTIDELKENAKKAGFKDIVSFEVINSLIEKKLDQNISQGNFLAGNITFCNIMPMRSIPFKITVLMGMDEKSFPRQDFTPGFSLIKQYPKAGDKIERDEDRYLFLETLLSARSKFICTYTGMSIQDNSKIPCAGVVSELSDIMERSFIFQKGYAYYFFHPLHPFDEEYFNQKNGFFSFSKDNCNITKALAQSRSEIKRVERNIFVRASLKKSKDQISTITLDEIIQFFKNPVQVYMKEGLNIKIPDVEDQTCDREVFSISGLDQYILGSFLVENKTGSSNRDQLYSIVKARGILPLGKKGKFEFEKIMDIADPVIYAARAITSKRKLPSIVREINIGDLRVSNNFSDIREDGIYFVSFGKLNSARLLSAWIRHLFLNICAPPGYPGETIIIGRDPKGKKPVVSFSFPALESGAIKYFKELTQIYNKGKDSPFYFFCETSWQFVQALLKDDFELEPSRLDRDLLVSAMKKSRPSWYGGYYQTGEKQNRYVSYCVENNDPFESVQALFSSGFVENSIAVYKPLLQNLTLKS